MPVTRIDNHAEWFSRSETGLPALPDRLKQYSVLPLLQAFARPEEAVNGATFPTDRFTDAVRGEGGRGRDIPHLSAALIRKYLSDMRQLQLL